MWLSSLKLIQFRNAIQRTEGPFAQFNGIFGPNGRGKTNFLEAIYYITHLKSWRTSQRKTLIHWAYQEASILATFESYDKTHDFRVFLWPNRREVLLDHKPLRSWESYRTPLIAILFSPDDAYLWREGPDKRRGSLDQMLFHSDMAYAGILQRYAKSLKQKNALLKQDRADERQLAIWNEQLVVYGSEMVYRRWRYLERVFPIFQKIYSQIVQGHASRETIGLHCKFLNQPCEGESAITLAHIHQLFRDQLKEKAALEGWQRTALVGPHRDDWGLTLDGQDVSSTASQGEHRSLIVALKLAELALLKEQYGETPLFLVDDLTSELDPFRRRFLMEALLETGCQTFLTSTESDPFRALAPSGSKFFEF